jgi:mono/diheme cytochrome c family protein
MLNRCLISLVLCGGSAAPVLAQPTGQTLALQARDVLHKHCFDCHGKNPKRLKGDLNLFDRSQLDDKDRKIIVAKKPDESALLVQVAEGKMPPGERPKLSATEQKILRDWIVAGAAAFPADPIPATAPASTPVDRPARVAEIFRVRCQECHGGSKTQAGVKILDHALLLRKRLIIPGKADESTVFQVVSASDDSAMPPPGQPRLSQDEVDTIRLWIAEGALALPAVVKAPAEPKRDALFAAKNVAGVDYVHKQILAHIRTIDTAERRFKRYFSINHILTAGATADELQVQREALAKAINHLSWEVTLARPMAIDPPVNSIFCIDLRELGWQRPVERPAAGAKPAAPYFNFFDLALLEYPYGIFYEDSETFNRLVEEFLLPAEQVRPVVYVRADWFVSTMTQPPFYEDFLRLPFEVHELERKLGVDAALDLREYRAARGGMAVSGVSKNNRVVQRHRASFGAYWKSFDFRSSTGNENIFRDPIDLHPAGGEMIFNLPNHLQGYFVTNSQGVRIAAAATEIVTDRFAEDKTVRNGLACMRCHNQGMKDFIDAVRPALLRLPGSPGFDKQVALQLYADQAVLDKLLQTDAERFATALAKLLGKPLRRERPEYEALYLVSHRFLDSPLLLATAGGELGLVDSALAELAVLFKTPQFSALGLVPLAVQGAVRRDAWESYFDQVVRGLGLGVPLVPIDGLSRPNFLAGPQLEVDLELIDASTGKKKTAFAPEDKAAILVRNRGAKPLYIELTGTSPRGRVKVLASSATVLAPGTTKRYPPTEGFDVRGELGKEQVRLLASPNELPASQYIRGEVTDRVIHAFYQLQKRNGRWHIAYEPDHLLKKTVEIETK